MTTLQVLVSFPPKEGFTFNTPVGPKTPTADEIASGYYNQTETASRNLTTDIDDTQAQALVHGIVDNAINPPAPSAPSHLTEDELASGYTIAELAAAISKRVAPGGN